MFLTKRYKHVPVSLGLVALVFILFGQTLNNGFNSDDYLVVYHAAQTRLTPLEAVKTFLHPSWGLYYRPAITLFFDALEDSFHLAPMGYHLVSLLCYSVLCIEVYAIGIALTKKISTAFAAALVFMTMTSHAEALFWISSLNGVVENVFSLASLICFIWWRRRSRGEMYALSMLLFIAALFLKESAVALPLVLILYDALLGDKFQWPEAARRTARSTWPFVLAAALFVILRALIMRQVQLPPPLTSFQLRTALLGLWHALLMTFSPIDWALAVTWFNKLQAGGMVFYLIAAFVLLMVAGLPLVLGKHRVVFLLGWTLCGAIPVIGLGLAPSERHVVFSSAGAAVLIAIILFGLAERFSKRFSISANKVQWAFILIFSATSFFFLNQRRMIWKKASDMAAGIVEQAVAAYPAPAPGTTFFFLNVPDMRDGAFVYRFDNLSYALRLYYKIPSVKAVRVVTPDRIAPGVLSNSTYACFRISAMGGNIYSRKGLPDAPSPRLGLSDLPFLFSNSAYLDNWSLYSDSPFLVYADGRLVPSSPEELKKVLQDIYSLR